MGVGIHAEWKITINKVLSSIVGLISLDGLEATVVMLKILLDVALLIIFASVFNNKT